MTVRRPMNTTSKATRQRLWNQGYRDCMDGKDITNFYDRGNHGEAARALYEMGFRQARFEQREGTA